MGWLTNFRDRVVDYFFGGVMQELRERSNAILDRREYRMGIQKKWLRVRPNQADDNLTLNFTALATERAVSMLFGKGIAFDTGEEAGNEDAQALIDDTWKYNHDEILLHNLAVSGAESGMCFVKLILQDEKPIRLVMLDPVLMDIETAPEDKDKVLSYTMMWKTKVDGQDANRKELTLWKPTSEDANVGYWEITNWVTTPRGEWELLSTLNWEWDFPPIIHWQNLPNPNNVWGLPDITKDVMEVQDRLNFVASNLSKIIRLYAHPQRWGVNAAGATKISLGPDDFVSLPDSPNSKFDQLTPAGDLAASFQFLLGLRQALFDITRTVDISSMADKIGALTNFGLHVLYQDALQKLETKRAMYEYGLGEINRRLLLLSNMEEITIEVVWPDPLPEDQTAALQGYQTAVDLGVVSRQTVSTELGYDWELEQERIQEERSQQDNIGRDLLAAFNRGIPSGTPAPMRGQRMPNEEQRQ